MQFIQIIFCNLSYLLASHSALIKDYLQECDRAAISRTDPCLKEYSSGKAKMISIEKYRERKHHDTAFQNRQALRILRDINHTTENVAILPESQAKITISRHLEACRAALSSLIIDEPSF